LVHFTLVCNHSAPTNKSVSDHKGVSLAKELIRFSLIVIIDDEVTNNSDRLLNGLIWISK